jgi:cytochrome c-type biogenesis protein
MESLLIAIPAAVWLGLLTSISPCPLATNIAALSFIGKEIGSTKRACWAGILYTAGRSITYAALGIVFGISALSIPLVSDFFQTKMNSVLGPVLILVGMVLLDLIHLDLRGSAWLEKAQKKAAAFGLVGSLLLGMLFAASFCPVSAALFFGSLVPLSIKVKSALLIPTVYGIATGLPVLVFSFFIVFGLSKLSNAYGKVVSFEKYARLITGVIFVIVGIYYSLIYIFGLPL